MTIKIGVNGYGAIGKRVADAVLLQKDMKLIGITAHSYNFRINIANERKIPIFPISNEQEFIHNEMKVAGNFENFLDEADVIVDCCPKPLGKDNKGKFYKPKKLKAIYQGGESSDVGEVSFVAQCNYEKAVNKDHIRVVSCNTTGLSRTIHALDQAFGVKRARATLIRRGTDPGEISRGPINAIVPSFELPSHHGPDVRTILPDVEVFTTAVIVPTTLMHIHNLSVKLKKDVKPEEAIEIFKKTPRVRVIKASDKIDSTASLMEFAKDLGSRRGDMMDICVWEEGVGVNNSELFFIQAIHQESDVVPENVDAIRAAIGFEDAKKSIEMTDKSLGLNHKNN